MRQRMKLVWIFAFLLLVGTIGRTASAQMPEWVAAKLDSHLQRRAALLAGQSQAILRGVDAASLAPLASLVQQVGGSTGRILPNVNSQVVTVPNVALAQVANSPLAQSLALDRPIVGAMERTGPTVGATAIRQALGYDGSGIGVAIIDSGVTSWHDDLADAAGGAQRVYRFVDFVNGAVAPYDDFGHGTHVAGIIAGNGFDSDGARSGIAPNARLVALKVLDANGQGHISDVIAALDYVVAHKDELNIRVVNLSVASGVYDSCTSDPLTLAALGAVNAGIVVVAAAGNNGRGPQGHTQYGGITAPGNAPWVLTVGAASHMGTIDRSDDTIATFSSRGPSAIDYDAKPDLVAPGVGIESLSDPYSALYTRDSAYLLAGTRATPYLPYLSLSGTSMATPVVTGTVALMLQANPALTPNAVKAILQYTSQTYAGFDALTQGAGFLNTKGAVELARILGQPSGSAYPSSLDWSRRIIWGNYLFAGGRLTADANAWSTSVTWSASATSTGQNINWGVICSATTCDAGSGTWSAWDVTAASQNVVWGTACGGNDCNDHRPWFPGVVTATDSTADTVVWGTYDTDTVVWGTNCADPSCGPVIWPGR
jgi:serine protease AprX